MNPPMRVPYVMRRTMANLYFIKQHAAKDGPYEVTQLINSFLGALAHPWEKHYKKLKTMGLDEAAKRGWPRIQKELHSDIDPEDLGHLLRLIRNSFAHGNLEFIPDNQDEIEFIRFWNEDPWKKGKDKRTWGSQLSVSDVHRILQCFVWLTEELASQPE